MLLSGIAGNSQDTLRLDGPSGPSGQAGVVWIKADLPAHFQELRAVGLAVCQNMESGEIEIRYATDSATLVLFQVLDAPDGVWFNYAKAYWEPALRNDTLHFASEMPFRATQVHYFYLWTGASFHYLEMGYVDPSITMLEEAEAALESGDIPGAVAAYNGVMYPYSYYNPDLVCNRLMWKAHQIGLESLERGELTGCHAMMDTVLINFYCIDWLGMTSRTEFLEAIANSYGAWSEDSVAILMGDYGMFLYKGRELDRSIEVNSRLVLLMPDYPYPYLWLADGLWDLADRAAAADVYRRYVETMRRVGKGKEVEKRAGVRQKKGRGKG
jgi:hypothetical protein